jgi:hypothetical protein
MNQGAVALKARLVELKVGQNEAAKRVEANSGNFSRIVNGSALPGRKVSANIWREFGVSPDLFDKAVEAGAA